jgi:RNA polymerase-binding transcription factor DksA
MNTLVYLQSTKPKTASPRRAAIPGKWDWHYRTLCRLRREPMEHRCALVQNSKEEVRQPGRDLADVATEEFDRNVLAAELAHNQDALSEVDAALERIETGAYGICEQSGRRIPASRLKAFPPLGLRARPNEPWRRTGMCRGCTCASGDRSLS